MCFPVFGLFFTVAILFNWRVHFDLFYVNVLYIFFNASVNPLAVRAKISK